MICDISMILAVFLLCLMFLDVKTFFKNKYCAVAFISLFQLETNDHQQNVKCELLTSKTHNGLERTFLDMTFLGRVLRKLQHGRPTEIHSVLKVNVC